LGHPLVATTPGLVPLTIDDGSRFHAQLSGVSHPVEIAVWIDGRIAIRLTGSLLWTHFGISGPVTLNASRHWVRAKHEGRDASITINVYPGLLFDDIDRHLMTMGQARPRLAIETALA